MNQNKQWAILIYALTFILNLLLVIALFSSLTPDDIKIYFNSDTLYLPSLYRDLFIDHNSLRGWHLNSSPNFFPDMALYFILMFVSRNFILSSFLFSIIQYMGILFLMPFLFRILIPQVSRLFIALSALLMTLFFLVTFCSKDFVFTFYILSNAYHTSAFVMGLICIILSLNYIKKPSKNKLIWLFSLCFLSILSDRLFIVVYSIPVFTLLIFLLKRQKVREVSLILLVNVIALVSGMGLFRLLDSSHYIIIDKPHRLLDFANTGPSFRMLSAQLTGYLLGFDFKSLIILLSLLSFTGSIFLFFRNRRTQEESLFLKFYFLFSVTFTLLVLFMPVIAGNYTGYDTIRYNIYVFYLSVINTGIIAAVFFNDRMMNRSVRRIVTSIPVIFSIMLVSVIIFEFSGNGLRQFLNYYPTIVGCVDDAAHKEKLLYGVGGYWDAKYITMFSKKGVRIYPVYDDLVPYNHITNENWYTGRHAVFNFIIQNHVSDSLAYRKRLGLTGERLNSGEAQLIKVPPFRYRTNDYRIVKVSQ